MKSVNVVRALKDQSYRNSLSAAQLQQVGNNPAGISDLDESLLDAVGGATNNACGDGGTGETFCIACKE